MPKIKSLIADGGVLLCANEQDATFWRRIWLGARNASSLPPILDWREFLSQLNEALEDAPPLLTDTEEIWLWRQVVRPAEAAFAVRRAWQLVREYLLDPATAWLSDAAHCADWAREVEQRAEAAGACLRASWPMRCKEVLHGKRALLPKRVAFSPGLVPPPALAQMLRGLHVPIEAWQSEERAQAQCFFLLAEDEHAEAAKAAAIAAEAIEQQRRVAILALEPEALARVRRMLARPPYQLLAADEEEAPPALCAAIDWLDALLEDVIAAPALRRWGWVAGRSELGCSLALQRPRWALPRLIEALQRSGEEGLARALQRARAWRTQRARFDEWAHRLQAWLEAMRLLRADDEDPFARASAHALREGLVQLARLATIAPAPVQAQAAFGELGLIWRGLSPLRFEAPMALLPFEEGVFGDWDLAIVLGCDEARLPWGARPVPLLQVAAQVAAEVPNANASLARREAQRLWRLLLTRSKKVIALSAAVREGEENAPSAWVREWKRWEAEKAPRIAVAQVSFEDPVRIEPKDAVLHGGVALLEAMAACPFQAQARFRWKLEAIEEPGPGIDPRWRGGVLHAALASFWTEVRSQQQLFRLDREGKTDALLAACVDRALRNASEVDEDWRRWFASHAMRVLRRWLDLERRRKPFAVRACEEEVLLRLGAHEIQLRIDRIDEDEDGRLILIDYKTGSMPELKEWCADPIRSCQMPAYLLAEPKADAGVFASLRLPGEEKEKEPKDWIGIAREGMTLGLSGVKSCDQLPGKNARWEPLATSLDALRKIWRQRLEALLDDFVRGISEIRPVDDRACKGCGLEGICRIGERRQ